MCQFSYWHEGHKTWSQYVPTSCQGCYFPGDEPGIYCAISGGACQNPEGDCPEDCEFQQQTDKVCPNCEGAKMILSGDGTLYCPICRHAE